MHYDPILCMNVPDEVRTTDEEKVIEKSPNGYTLGIAEYRNSGNGVVSRIYLTFPGETKNNPHMFLGEPTPKNIQSAKELFNKFKNIKHKDASPVYSVSYKYNGVYQSIGVRANSESEAIKKAKTHFEKNKKNAEILGASIDESEETMKRKGKPIIDEAIRSCDADYFIEYVKDFQNLANKIMREFKDPEAARKELSRIALSKIDAMNDKFNDISRSHNMATNTVRKELADYSSELFKKYREKNK